jgi:hypothetical protein
MFFHITFNSLLKVQIRQKNRQPKNSGMPDWKGRLRKQGVDFCIGIGYIFYITKGLYRYIGEDLSSSLKRATIGLINCPVKNSQFLWFQVS